MTLRLLVSFSETVISSFEDTWDIEKQDIYLETMPLMRMSHVLPSLGHATLRLAQIAAVDSNF